MTNINSLVVTREVMQWAAVTTHLELTRLPENVFLKFIRWKGKILIRPPQKKPELGCDLRLMRAIHGYSFTFTIKIALIRLPNAITHICILSSNNSVSDVNNSTF